MNTGSKLFLAFYFLIIAFSCSVSSQKRKLSIQLVEEVLFRRSYADAQFIDDKKEAERYLEEQENSPPQIVPLYDTVLKRRLEALGFVKGSDLLLDSFQSDDSIKTLLLENNLSTPVSAKFEYSDLDSLRIIIGRGPDSASIMQPRQFSDMYFAIADIRPGGYKEILFVRKNYFMLGNNFDLAIYEIR